MADNFNPIYTIDAGVIIAKLHLAGKSQAKGFIVVNSAIEGESASDTPEKPGKCKFNTDIKSGKFDVVFIAEQTFVYYKQLKLEAFKEYKTYITIKEKGAKNPQATKNKDQSKITDKPKENEGEQEQKNDELKNAFRSLIDAVTKCNTDSYKFEKLNPEKATEEDLKKAVDASNTARAEDFKKHYGEHKSNAVKAINNYFQTFVGKDSFKKVSDPITQYFDEKVSDLSKVTIKDFQVIGISEKDIKKLEQTFLKDQTKPTNVKIGFKVACDIELIG